jgi:Rrf2 family protein
VLSSTADYALRAVLLLALCDPGSRLRADEIAESLGAPRNYLAKTLHALAKAGIVRSTRGPQGGFALAVAPSRLTLARVVDLFDGPRARPRCMLGDAPCDEARPCAVHQRWTAILAAQRTPLTATTVAELLAHARPRAR